MVAILRRQSEQTILGAAPLRIGSAPDNQLVLNDVSVEPYHTELRLSDEGYTIVDLSRNSSTFVNEQRLEPNTPHLLQNGDWVRIGNVQLTYEVMSSFSALPTVTAPGQPGDAGHAAKVTPSGNSIPPAPPTYVRGPISSPNVSLSPAPLPTSNMNSGSTYDPYIYPPQKRGNKTLWIVLGGIGCVFILPLFLLLVVPLIVVFFLPSKDPSGTPTHTLQAYCSAVKGHDTHTAYNTYSGDAQKQSTFPQIRQRIALATDCTVSNVNDTDAIGTVTYTLSNGGKISDRETLTNQDDGWKITATQSTPSSTLTLFNYCSALTKSNYQDAYNLFTTNGQNQWDTEQHFEDGYPPDKLTDCTVSNLNDTAGSGDVTLIFPAGKLTFNEQLVNNGGTWKIDKEQRSSTPTLTLTTYCNALRQKDYHTAYNQISSATTAKYQETEPVFAAAFTLGSVTSCSVGIANDTAGFGSISFSYSDNTKETIAYILVQEKGTWKLSDESTPTTTLHNYCSALKQKDYPTAYNLLSSAQQAIQTESQYKDDFKDASVSDCSVTRSDDAVGTGSISYNFSNNSKGTADYTLVQEKGAWKIQTEKML